MYMLVWFLAPLPCGALSPIWPGPETWTDSYAPEPCPNEWPLTRCGIGAKTYRKAVYRLYGIDVLVPGHSVDSL